MDPLAQAPSAPDSASRQTDASPGGGLPEIVSGTNPLTTAANPLLNLIPQLRATANADPARVRDFLVEQIRAFELRARASGIAPEVIIGGRYALCTALDETAALTPWGGTGVWSKHSLLVTFHNEVWGGEKFFQLLGKLAQNPQQHADLLELMYYCLALGFEGRFRIVDNGRTQLETLKVRLADMLKQMRGGYEQPLAQHWRGVAAPPKPAWQMLPVWVAGALMLLIAAGVYAWLSYLLRPPVVAVDTRIAAIQPKRLQDPLPPAPPPPVARLRLQAPPEDAALVKVSNLPDRDVATLQGESLFDSGKTNIREPLKPVLARIAKQIAALPGMVTVKGHTDNVPVRGTRFRSNQELSQARAETVKEFLSTYVAPARMRAVGAGEAEPIGDNASPEGRAQNRRVDLIVDVPPAGTAAPAPAPSR